MAENHVDHLVDDYVFGLLTADEASQLEAHCEQCEACQTALQTSRRLQSTLHDVAPTEASGQLIKRAAAHMEDHIARGQHRWRNTVRAIASLAAAAVLLIGSFQAYVSSQTASPYDIRILGQNEWIRGSYASVRVGVFDTNSGKTVEDVPVELALEWRGEDEQLNRTQLVSFNTSGATIRSPRFLVPDVDAVQLIVTAKPDRKPEVMTASVSTRRAWKLMASTDKPVYQPGQTIEMRALSLKQPTLKPVAEQPITFSLTDPKGNLVFRNRQQTSQYGIASSRCELAREIIEGDYELQIELDEVVSKRTLRVAKYVLPKFKLDVSLDQPFFVPGEMISGKIDAQYFFGKSVTDGVVQLDLFGTRGKRQRIDQLEVRTDEDGKATFAFEKSQQWWSTSALDEEVEVVAQLKDTAGQSQSRMIRGTVTARPLHVELIAEGGDLTPNVANRIYVYTSDASGRPVSADLEFTSGAQGKHQTNAQGLAVVEVTPSKASHSLGVSASYSPRDPSEALQRLAQKPITITKQFSVGGPRDFLVRPHDAVLHSGDTLTVTGLAEGSEPIFVDLLQDGQCVLSETLEIQSGRGLLDIDLPADLMGTVQMVAYRFGADGLPVRRSRTLFVKPGAELKIAAELDRESYKPGETAKLKLRLSDSDGKPSPGAISLAAVDEAVFSVLNQSAGVDRVFFLLEQELLKPVYTIYPWSPWDEGGDVQPLNRDDAFLSLTSQSSQSDEAVPAVFRRGGSTEKEAVDPMLLEEGPDFEPGDNAQAESPFNLQQASYSAKLYQLKDWQYANHRLAANLWLGLLAALALTATVLTAIYRPWWMLAVVPLFLVALMTYQFMSLQADTSVVTETAFLSLDVEEEFDMMALDSVVMDTPNEALVPESPAANSTPARPRVRRHFPETLLWRPELVTNDQGEVEIEIPLADSITAWRLSVSAVGSGGQMGVLQQPLRVFQPFFVDLDLPVALTRGDEATVPIVVYNYLQEQQEVALKVEPADWFEFNGQQPELALKLGPGEVRSVGLPIRVLDVGQHSLKVAATSGEESDAVVRKIEVVPNGLKMETVFGATLEREVKLDLALPADIVPGSAQAFVKLYPSSFSQLIEGLDSIFKMPHGCFEQTSSTTYPNVLALEYLRKTKQSKPQIEAKARQYIHLGYQRLLSFEIPGGGFDWYGSPPAKLTLTAYGLMEFADMAKVHDVDPNLLQRTRDWLLSKRQPDGGWAAPQAAFSTIGRANAGGLATTAYVAWSVFAENNADAAVTLDYLLKHEPTEIEDPYLLALAMHAIHAIQPEHPVLDEYAQQLARQCKSDAGTKYVWWETDEGQDTMFYGSGVAGHCETTALAAMALMKANGHRALSESALAWLTSKKDANGTWHSTQATVLALKALTLEAGHGRPESRLVELNWNGEALRPIEIAADQQDVVQLRDLTSNLSTGENTLAVSEPTETGIACQVVFRYYVEEQEESGGGGDTQEPLSIDIQYDQQRLKVDDTVTAVATIRNNMDGPAPMVMIDLPIPGGFRIEAGELEELKGSGKIARYQITPRQAIIYLRGLEAGAELKLRYRLKAVMPVKVTVPAGQVYEYYNPDVKGRGKPTALTVEA